MRTKNEEHRDRLAQSALEALRAERGAEGFTLDEALLPCRRL